MQEQSRVIASMPEGDQKRRAEADFSASRKARLQAKADAAANRAAALATNNEHVAALEDVTAIGADSAPVEIPVLLKTKTSDDIGSTNRRDR